MMIVGPVPIKFEGRYAKDNLVDIKALSNALSGLDRMANSSMYLLNSWEVPTNRQRAPFKILVSPPKKGSYEFLMQILSPDGALPLVSNVIATQGQEIVWRILSSMLLSHSNRKKEMDPHFEELMKLTQDLRKDRNISEERFVGLIEKLCLANQNPAAKLVSNVGRDVNSLILPNSKGETIIGAEDAEVIRQKGELVAGEVEQYHALVDGLISHNRTLKLVLDNLPDRIITALAIDPAFDQSGNIYVQAYDQKFKIIVETRPLFRGNELAKLVVLTAKKAPK